MSPGSLNNVFDIDEVIQFTESAHEDVLADMGSEGPSQPPCGMSETDGEGVSEKDRESEEGECSFYTEEETGEGSEADDEWEDPELENIRKKALAKTIAGLEFEMGGTKDKAGKKRGFYGVDGPAERTIRRHIKEAKDCNNWVQVEKWEKRRGTKGLKQRTLWGFTSSTSTASDIQSDLDGTPPPKRQHVDKSPIDLTVDSDQESITTTTLTEEPTHRAHCTNESDSPDNPDSSPPPQSDHGDEEDEHIEPLDLDTLKKLASAGLKRATSKALTREINLYAALVDFYTKRANYGRMKSADYVAASRGKGVNYARGLRTHARYFEETQTLRPSRLGFKIALSGVLDDEGVMAMVREWLRTMKPGTVTPNLLCHYMKSTVLPGRGLKKLSISIRQVQRWLPRLGYRRRPHMKGVYWDGHERKDVKKRRTAYLKELIELERVCTQYLEDPKTTPATESTIPPTLNDGEKECVLIWHDEMAVHANDCQKEYWARPDETVLRKKDPGRLMMVSDFITAATETGRLVMDREDWEKQLRHPESERLPRNARVIIYPSSKPGTDDYWNMRQMISQLEKTIKLAEHILPDKTLVFIFDNSSAHNSMPSDGLHISKMNIGPGGAASKMRDTIIPHDNPAGHGGHAQAMQFPDHLPEDDFYKEYEGKPKGIRRLLEERGLVTVHHNPLKVLNRAGQKVIGQCKTCKEEKARRCPPDVNSEIYLDIASDSEDDEDSPAREDCCMTRILSLQQDFKDQKSLLEQVITKAGHQCIFLPKFHCELNPIEYYWGWVKRYFRERCTGTKFDAAKKLLTESLDACPGIVIRRFIRRANRYASVYRLGATGPLADYAVRKYKSHRTVSQRELDLAVAAKKKRDEKAVKVSLK